MSQRRDRFEERLDEYESQLESVYRLYHIPVLAAIMGFMLWIRVRYYERMIGADGQPLYRGNDPYYHRRTTEYVIRNYPNNMPYEVWSGFDTGTQVGQFGTIFDQIVATVALIVGLGSPSKAMVTLVTVLTPAVIAVLCVPPMYYVGKRLGGRPGGLIGVIVLAITPGSFLTRSVAGVYDHHIAESLGTVIVLAVGMTMLAVAQEDKPIYEFVETREFDLLKRPAVWGAGFGAALALTMLVWPPAMFLFGLYAIFLFFHLSLEFVRGNSPDHVAIPSIIAMIVTALIVAPFMTSFGLETTELSLLQPLLAMLVAGGAAFMAGVARLWESRDVPRSSYPAAVVGTGLLVAGVVMVVAPDTFDFFVRQVERVAGLGSTDTAATVGEAAAIPEGERIQFFYFRYGLAFYTAILGILLMAVRALIDERPNPEYILIAVFLALIVLFTLTQRRFDYYLALGVAASNAFLFGQVLRFIDLEDVKRDITAVKPFQVLVVVAILFIVAGPFLAAAAPQLDTTLRGPVDTANGATNPGEFQDWQGSLEWLSSETPAEGEYGGSGERDLEYYGSYAPTDDFEYKDGEYGVMAWWDYGHYITYGGERVPVANPFQQHATEAADFLLAGNETEANRILEEDEGEASGTRYVMIDYKLGYAGTRKYNAPVAFESRHNLSASDIGINVYNRRGPIYGIHTQRAYESMRVRLYQFHGSAKEPATYVSRFDTTQRGLPVPPSDGRPVRDYGSVEEAREAAQSNPNSVHGGLAGRPGERVEALDHYRLVHGSEPSSSRQRLRKAPIYGGGEQGPVVPYVKTFERVDGAQIEGTGPANTEVRASVEMRIPTTGQTFTYQQFAQTDDQGNFEMTVPYSTTGYDEYGLEAGYTNVSVRANSSYQFIAVPENSSSAFLGSAAVTEGQVIGENDTTVQVDLERRDVSGNQTQQNGTDTGQDSGTSEGDSGTNETTDTNTSQGHRGARAA